MVIVESFIFFWSIDDIAPTLQPFTEQPRPKVPPSYQTPQDCFSLFIDDDMLRFLLERTNEYAEKKYTSNLTCMYMCIHVQILYPIVEHWLDVNS